MNEKFGHEYLEPGRGKKTKTNTILMTFFGVCLELEPGTRNRKKTNMIQMKFFGVSLKFVSN